MYRKLVLLLCALAMQGCTTAMVVGAVVGVPLIVLGLMLMVRGIF